MSSRPQYELIRKIDNNIEIRRYLRTVWVSTNVASEARNFEGNKNFMFGKLFNYISGSNDRSQKIAMTAPVTYDIRSTSGQREKINDYSNVRMSMRFYLPVEYQNNPPKPTNDAYLEEDQTMVVAAIKFGGYAGMNDYMHFRDILIERLGNEANNYDTINFIGAAYDPPFKTTDRTNEVWLRKIA